MEPALWQFRLRDGTTASVSTTFAARCAALRDLRDAAATATPPSLGIDAQTLELLVAADGAGWGDAPAGGDADAEERAAAVIRAALLNAEEARQKPINAWAAFCGA